jgi:hypothetical protein
MRMVGAPRAPAIEVPRRLTLGRRLQRPAGPAECGYRSARIRGVDWRTALAVATSASSAPVGLSARFRPRPSVGRAPGGACFATMAITQPALDHVAACGASRSPRASFAAEAPLECPGRERRSRVSTAGDVFRVDGDPLQGHVLPDDRSTVELEPLRPLCGRRGLTARSLGAVLGAGHPTQGGSPS